MAHTRSTWRINTRKYGNVCMFALCWYCACGNLARVRLMKISHTDFTMFTHLHFYTRFTFTRSTLSININTMDTWHVWGWWKWVILISQCLHISIFLHSFFFVQDEKNQIITTNVWLNLVSNIQTYLRRSNNYTWYLIQYWCHKTLCSMRQG